MDFLNEFSKRFTNVARSVSEKSKESTELTRLNAELRAARESLDRLYCRYGQVCYATRLGASNQQEMEQLALRIRAARLELDEITARRDAAREMKRCPGCGAVHPAQARFCSSCGKRLPEAAPKAEPVELGEYCPSCGAKREGREALCPVCGAAFEQPAEVAPASEPKLPVDVPDVEEPAGDDDGSWE